MRKKLQTLNPIKAAVIGLLSTAPFLTLNFLVSNQIEPILSILRPDGTTNILEQIVVLFLLLILPLIGAFITVFPMFANKKLYLLNIIIAIILTVGPISISYGLAYDIYKCDILKIPNCD